MTIPIRANQDFGGVAKPVNLPSPIDAGDAVNKAYVDAHIEGLGWKDEVRAATTGNVNLANPGTASFDGVTLSEGDRLLVLAQTEEEENGIYVFNSSSTPLVRSADASAFAELHAAVVTVAAGTANGGATFRQTQVGGTINTDDIIWETFGSGVPDATDAIKGKVRLATQAEVDDGSAGGDPAAVMPETLDAWGGRVHVHAQDIGDNSNTSLTVTHNFNNRDVTAVVRENSGDYREAMVEKRFALNSVTFVFAAAPATDAYRAIITGQVIPEE